jgi:hypothetical protein
MLQAGISRVRFLMRLLDCLNLPNRSSRTMTLGWTQPLTEMSKWRPARKADNLTVICETIFYRMWEPRRLTTYGPPLPVTGIALRLST